MLQACPGPQKLSGISLESLSFLGSKTGDGKYEHKCLLCSLTTVNTKLAVIISNFTRGTAQLYQ